MTSHANAARRRRAIPASALVVALVAAACSGGDDGAGSTDAARASVTETAGGLDESPAAGDVAETTTPDSDATATSAEPADTTTTEPPPTISEDRAFYVLPPGNYGGIPTNDDSLDQLPLYDGLTPLRGEVSDADIETHFLAQDFEPVGETVEEPTGRAGTTILYDEFGVAHITGETREDLAFGAGWVSARDRGLLIDLGRGPARAALADVPGIDAF
jgi:hypothetical protein